MRKIEYIAPETMVIDVNTEPLLDVSMQNVYNTETNQYEEVVTSISKYDVWDESQNGEITVY